MLLQLCKFLHKNQMSLITSYLVYDKSAFQFRVSCVFLSAYFDCFR